MGTPLNACYNIFSYMSAAASIDCSTHVGNYVTGALAMESVEKSVDGISTRSPAALMLGWHSPQRSTSNHPTNPRVKVEFPELSTSLHPSIESAKMVSPESRPPFLGKRDRQESRNIYSPYRYAESDTFCISVPSLRLDYRAEKDTPTIPLRVAHRRVQDCRRNGMTPGSRS